MAYQKLDGIFLLESHIQSILKKLIAAEEKFQELILELNIPKEQKHTDEKFEEGRAPLLQNSVADKQAFVGDAKKALAILQQKKEEFQKNLKPYYIPRPQHRLKISLLKNKRIDITIISNKQPEKKDIAVDKKNHTTHYLPI